jgi:K(+)-stimulated pyrophosphate-energized sodium pump
MTGVTSAIQEPLVQVTGGNIAIAAVVAVVAVLALAVAGGLVREVLAANDGTERMKEIARAVQ